MSPKTFVVPLDGSDFAERALPIAESLAERIGGRLLLVSTQPHGPLEPEEYLDEVAQRYERMPVDIVATKRGRAAEVIAEAVASSTDRVVCMTTHGRGGLRWAAVGSVAEELIRTTDRPLLLVGRHCRPGFLTHGSRLVACSNGSETSADLASAAHEWSELLALDLSVAVVVHPLDVESAEHPGGLLDPIASQFDVDRAATQMIRSTFPAGAIADLAEELPAAILAMSCHGRTGVSRVALGSTTMSVLQLAPCPLLVTRRASGGSSASGGEQGP